MRNLRIPAESVIEVTDIKPLEMVSQVLSSIVDPNGNKVNEYMEALYQKLSSVRGCVDRDLKNAEFKLLCRYSDTDAVKPSKEFSGQNVICLRLDNSGYGIGNFVTTGFKAEPVESSKIGIEVVAHFGRGCEIKLEDIDSPHGVSHGEVNGFVQFLKRIHRIFECFQVS